MQRVGWYEVPDALDKVWYFVDIICDFTVECGVHGPMIHTGYLPVDDYPRADKTTLGHTNITTQHRRLVANAISKAIDIAYIQVFKKRMEGRNRLAHVAMDKVPPELIIMCKHIFMWYGCGDEICIYNIPISFTTPVVDQPVTSVQSHHCDSLPLLQ
jgi:hypothetical protein